MISWEGFPMEIRLAVLKELMQDACSLANFATVSREWQKIMEPHNFSRIKLMSARLVDPAILNIFTTLRVWEPGNSLLLDISVYSPSDSKHWFKYLTFEPDDAFDMFDRNQHTVASMTVRPTDHRHGWISGSRNSILSSDALEKPCSEIMGECPFDDEEQEGQWWQQLPLVPAVTGVLLRQQSRRRWKPPALARDAIGTHVGNIMRC
ncbi:uncharacterized protein EAE98_010965 [Botrytis deweyae]|uniref:F-box domain-containing protein n=1 Tax=Botrytis deweyae TaxID=2478750 RepID=A0ABQ7I7L7_9HELO|nr:uncharacterized protein EAE98_010965 [Botrytis deweyae]KAF7915885.1 hypothetical protein EAE98_010965 [Botrytis deweyae]